MGRALQKTHSSWRTQQISFERVEKGRERVALRVVSEGVSTCSKKARDPGLAVIELKPGHLFADPWKLSTRRARRREQVERK